MASYEIDAKRWIRAEDNTVALRLAVQCSLYRDDDAVKNEKRAGLHVIRNLTLLPGAQVVWQKFGSHEDYEAVHAEMLERHRLYCIRLIISEYVNPSPDELPATPDGGDNGR